MIDFMNLIKKKSNLMLLSIDDKAKVVGVAAVSKLVHSRKYFTKQP